MSGGFFNPRRYHCETCGCVEHLNIAPDCCSLCGSSLTCDAGEGTTQADYDAMNYQAEELAYADEESAVAVIGPKGLTALALCLFCAVFTLMLPVGLEVCQQSHSFETCHHALYR